LEAGYAQIGAGLGSFFGQKLRLRRNDLRLLVAAGAAAAIGGAFNAPLTGAFYGFEVALGGYSIAGAAPIFAASITGMLVTRFIASAPYQIETPSLHPLVLSSYLTLIGLARWPRRSVFLRCAPPVRRKRRWMRPKSRRCFVRSSAP
jgi:CIC family chloride channel protein